MNRETRRQNFGILFWKQEGRAVLFLGIHKSEPDIYIGFSLALHLKCGSFGVGSRNKGQGGMEKLPNTENEMRDRIIEACTVLNEIPCLLFTAYTLTFFSPLVDCGVWMFGSILYVLYI
jgi:hypothetical protein